MKKLITSASLAAMGVASLHSDPMMSSMETSKPWRISAALRGFYDDNYTTSPKATRRESFGFEVSPEASINLFREQTTIGLSYNYSLKYYDDRSRNKLDEAHVVSAKVSHAFTPRLKADLSDSFVSAQEPDVIEQNGTISIPLRSDGNNIRNTAQATLSADLNDTLGTSFTYSNTFYDYDEEGTGSRSSLLDRMEHLASLKLRYTIIPSTIGVIGYDFLYTDYNSPGLLGVGTAVRGEDRTSISHFGYVGVDHTFSHQLNASARVGVEYKTYEHPSIVGKSDDVSPYAEANVTYNYTVGGNATVGIRHSKNPTDVGYLGGPNPTLDTETTTLYGAVSHQILPQFTIKGTVQYQNSTFEGGLADSLTDNYLLAGLSLGYDFNKFLSAEAGYNYDRLDSELHQIGVARSFTRNRIWIGIRASY